MNNFKTILEVEKQKYKDSNNQKPNDTVLKLFNPLLINPLNLKNFHGKGYDKL